MTKKQENETSKELGMESKKNSGKSGKLKISVSAIRKGEKKTENKSLANVVAATTPAMIKLDAGVLQLKTCSKT